MQTAALPFSFADAFFIVGPTGCGKTEIGAEVAAQSGAEVIGADAFQVYRGLARLTAHPSAATLQRVPHHLIGAIPVGDEMSADRYREHAREAMREIAARGKTALVVGGSGLYVRALMGGFAPSPPGDPALRERLNQLSLGELSVWLRWLDGDTTQRIDMKNKRRVHRALEICLLSGKPASRERAVGEGDAEVRGERTAEARERGYSRGVFVFRDRDDLYQRINLRVEQMFADGVVEEVRTLGEIGATAQQAIGWWQIRALLGGEMTMPECIAAIQQATRQYAKRQLTWFRHQTSFEPLNLSLCSTAQAVERIAEIARPSFAR